MMESHDDGLEYFESGGVRILHHCTEAYFDTIMTESVKMKFTLRHPMPESLETLS